MADNPAGTLQGDYSSMYSGTLDDAVDGATKALAGLSSHPIGNLLLGDYYSNVMNSRMNEQAASNAFVRDMIKLQEQNIFNASEAQKSRDFESAEAQKNRDYQTLMSNSAYQRAVSDMKAAGLNPALLYSNGMSSTPTGSTAHGTSASSGSGSSPGASSSSWKKGEGAQLAGLLIKVIAGLIAG